MIWKCRDKTVFNNIAPSHHELWSRANLYRSEFVEMQQKNLQENRLKTTRWNPPQSDYIHKLNVVMSQSKKSNSVGIGLILCCTDTDTDTNMDTDTGIRQFLKNKDTTRRGHGG